MSLLGVGGGGGGGGEALFVFVVFFPTICHFFLFLVFILYVVSGAYRKWCCICKIKL